MGSTRSDPLITTAGVGVPEVASWARVSSSTVSALTIHRSPEASKARSLGDEVAAPLMVTSGVGLPPAANWAWLYSQRFSGY